jgi:hypothetical protein
MAVDLNKDGATTGHFYKGALYQVDPVGFDIDDFFDQIGS